MKHKVLFVERKPYDSFSIEKTFRQIAANLSDDFEAEFQQLPYGNRIWDTARNLLLFRKKKADIYHITGHVHYISLLFSPRNTVLSIMDVRFLYRNPGLRLWMLKKLYLDWPLGKLSYVTAISDETKAEIVRYTGCDPAKITVLDLPFVVSADVAGTRQFNQERPTILQVGTMENKNLPNLAKALNGINCKLRVIGRMTPAQVSALKESKVDYENAFELTDDEIRKEYQNADMVTFCSIYEGFGLPIIEAQSMRKPVITSNLSPMIETAGGGAVLVDPTDYLGMREGIMKVIHDAGFRDELIAAGLKNIERFKPARVAAGYEELYKKVLRPNQKSV